MIPGYYNDYLNSYLRHLSANDLFLKPMRQVYFDNNAPLQTAVNKLLSQQDVQEKHHDKFFRQSKQEHSLPKALFEFCCGNIRRHKTPLSSGHQAIESAASEKKIDVGPVYERDFLISHTLFMFSQVQLAMEIFQPVVLGGAYLNHQVTLGGT